MKNYSILKIFHVAIKNRVHSEDNVRSIFINDLQHLCTFNIYILSRKDKYSTFRLSVHHSKLLCGLMFNKRGKTLLNGDMLLKEEKKEQLEKLYLWCELDIGLGWKGILQYAH